MVNIGEDHYAIPLTSIEGVVRVSPYELEAYYEEEESIFNYAGVDYKLQYLGAYMHGHERPHLLGQTRPLPVLLVQTGEQPVALQVDSLLGSREIVVKSVGPQLSTVAGLSGATILGDGSVVIILDIHSMIRGAAAQEVSDEVQATAVEAREDDRPMQVMVIDDSVTVRKVTSRLLERNGMEVILAKDGVDAVTQLQDVKPDVMLLDIEMPRMDGFEVATVVRNDERLKEVPIIMITSRTGEKHKQRAMDIGVNRYMGKPFQENELLGTITELMTGSEEEKV
jgi:chemosensory pili system protein ChpA (sensor histidine kinase/response regulator)